MFHFLNSVSFQYHYVPFQTTVSHFLSISFPVWLVPHEFLLLYSTLFHASLVLLPILGVTWILGFFVVGDSLYSLVVEWLFCIFTTLQGVMILVMHCIFNRAVRENSTALSTGPHSNVKWSGGLERG